MAWTLAGVRLFVTEYQNDYKQTIAKLNPFNSNSVYHIFGWESAVDQLSAYVVGDTDKAALKALTRNGTAVTLISDVGSYGNFYVNKISLKRINSICQTLRGDLSTTSPVYVADIELYMDE